MKRLLILFLSLLLLMCYGCAKGEDSKGSQPQNNLNTNASDSQYNSTSTEAVSEASSDIEQSKTSSVSESQTVSSTTQVSSESQTSLPFDWSNGVELPDDNWE